MPLLTLHACRFGFKDKALDRIGNSVDGGTSLSGFTDQIETTGGGYWQLTLSNGSTREAGTGADWRGLAEYLTGYRSVDVLICDRLFQPNPVGVHRHDLGVLTDGSEYAAASPYTASAGAVLRATTLKIASSIYGRPIRPGNLFSINHPTWGWRTYRIATAAADGTVTFGPPLREAIPAGTALDFDNPRCRMYAPQPIAAPVNLGRFISCALTLVEDMRPPVTP
jgi:hypothetical protein